MRYVKYLLFTSLFLALAGVPASAHSLITATTPPFSQAKAIAIDDPSVSRVYYSAISLERPQTWLKFSAKAGDRIYLSVGVPKLARLSAFRPLAALLGPGLPEPSAGLPLPPDSALITGQGALLFLPREQPEEFHEGVTGTDSWIVMEETITLPASGTYYFVAYPRTPREAENKLWVAIGTKERFTLKDLFALPSIKRYVRNFHELKR